MIPNRIVVDLIGKFFISLPSEFRTNNKDVPLHKGHPLSRVLLLQMHRLHIRICGARYFYYRAKQVCNGA